MWDQMYILENFAIHKLAVNYPSECEKVIPKAITEYYQKRSSNLGVVSCSTAILWYIRKLLERLFVRPVTARSKSQDSFPMK